MPNSSLATVEEDGGVILSRVQVLSPVGAREVTVVPAAKNQTKPNQTRLQDLYYIVFHELTNSLGFKNVCEFF